MHQAEIIKAVKDFFRQHSSDDVVCVYVFGSTGRGEARPDSDLDVAVLYRVDPPHTLSGVGIRLAGELERNTGHPVDVVVLNRAPVDLVHHVLRDGTVIYETDSSTRIQFEVRSRNVYFDLQPILERYRRGEARMLHG